MKEEKKMYAWMPSNCAQFDEVYESIEEAVEEAQKQWDEKYEHYEYEDEDNDTEIALMTVAQFNPEKCMERFGEKLIEKLDENLGDFTYGCEVDSEVYCKDVPKFNKAVREALMPVIKEHLSFYMDQVGMHLALTYNVKTRKYLWDGKESDSIPEAFRNKEENQ